MDRSIRNRYARLYEKQQSNPELFQRLGIEIVTAGMRNKEKGSPEPVERDRHEEDRNERKKA